VLGLRRLDSSFAEEVPIAGSRWPLFEGQESCRAIGGAVVRVRPSRSRESLSQALATTLHKHDGFAWALLIKAGFKLVVEGWTFEVRTQKAFRTPLRTLRGEEPR
jgi:hypothetical protein